MNKDEEFNDWLCEREDGIGYSFEKSKSDMDEDIKTLERMLKIEKECLHYDVSQDEIRAIEHLIKAYKELEELKDNKVLVRRYFNLKDNSIPVSLVEEKILNPMKEDYNKAIKGFIKRDIPQCIEDGVIAQELGYFIVKIEELLEKR